MSFETIYQICRITQPHFMQFLIGIRIRILVTETSTGIDAKNRGRTHRRPDSPEDLHKLKNT